MLTKHISLSESIKETIHNLEMECIFTNIHTVQEHKPNIGMLEKELESMIEIETLIEVLNRLPEPRPRRF